MGVVEQGTKHRTALSAVPPGQRGPGFHQTSCDAQDSPATKNEPPKTPTVLALREPRVQE